MNTPKTSLESSDLLFHHSKKWSIRRINIYGFPYSNVAPVLGQIKTILDSLSMLGPGELSVESMLALCLIDVRTCFMLNPFLFRIRSMLGLCWVRIYIQKSLCWIHIGSIYDKFWFREGSILSLCGEHIWSMLRLYLVHVGCMLGPCYVPIEFMLGLFWVYDKYMLNLCWMTLEPMLSRFHLLFKAQLLKRSPYTKKGFLWPREWRWRWCSIRDLPLSESNNVAPGWS